MKSLSFILVLLFTISFSFANETDDFKNKARELKTNNEFKDAIKFYIKAIKLTEEEKQLAELYFEVSDCYFQIGNKKMAIRVIEEAIIKFGVTKMDIISNDFTCCTTNYFLVDNIKNYNSLRQKYISKLKDIDAFLIYDDYLVKK
ncbi:tetratricopeptide repeat protein [Flavobacterium sp. N2270]|uniref:tetratricopeptide repeat protein n=1 Tax=Flavobacterium sp. N2270 TaxID=2986831 RepID=UPI00222493E9|nr:hypothetical protein [Flavobacterium sp. N2270]